MIKGIIYSKRRLLAVLMSFAMLFCSIPNGAEAAKKKLKATCPKTVAVNKSIKIKTNMKCNFKSSNKKIATVSSKGVVKGKKAGKVKITVTAKKTKQKKTVTITVKKQAKKVVTKTPSTSEPETTPTVIATQPPQGGVPQTPKPPEGVSPTPNAPTLMPNRTATPGTSTTPPTIPSPNVPSTQKPSVSPVPTSTATSSPTNPSTTRKPVGITAEFEGKIPINRELSNEATAMRMLIDATITVKLRYDDNTEEQVRPLELYVDQEIVEENGTKFIEATVRYKEFTTVLKVELVDVPKDVLYPIYIDCSYVGATLKKNQIPDLKDINTQVIMVDQSSLEIDSKNIRIADIEVTEDNKEYMFIIIYDYYFYYNGEKLHAPEGDIIYIPYE